MAHDPLEAHGIEPENVDWLCAESIGERIPKGMISVVAGRPDQGKGLFAAYLAAQVSKLGGNVLYSAIEDAHGLMTRPRLEAAGANLRKVFLWRFQLPSMFEELAAHIIDKDIDLLVMDPFAAHLAGGVSRGSDTIRQILNPLTELIEETGTAVLIVEHVLKRVPPNGHPLNAIGGSGSGLPAAARAAYVLGVDPTDDDARMLCCVKCNLREKPQAVRFEIDTREVEKIEREIPCLVYDDEIEFDAMRLFEGKNKGAVGRPPDKRAAAAEWLTTYLAEAGEPVLSSKVLEDALQYNMSRKTLRRAATDMEIIKDPPGGGRKCTWALPDAVLEALAGVDGDAPEGDAPEGEGDEDLTLSDADLQALLGEEPVSADEVGEGGEGCDDAS